MKSEPSSDFAQENLSSYNLFHFTNNLDYILNILEYGFLHRYNYEKLPKARVAYICRMVCFCDIPLGRAKYHLNWYGNYGLGLNKSYCKKLGITPVIYVHSNSNHITFSASKSAIEKLKANPITPYLKQQRGKVRFLNKDTQKPYFKWKTFYDEKEWRYVPKRNGLETVSYSKEEELLELKENKNKDATERLKLDLGKIEYVILDNSKEIRAFINFLSRLQSKIAFDKNLMLSKIVTSSQIKKDF